MSARILDGRALSESIRGNLAVEVGEFRLRHGRAPGLTVVLVGDDPASHVYVRNKRQACRAAGIEAKLHKLPNDVGEADLLRLVETLNGDDKVHGILVQLPLPEQIREATVLYAINPLKDVDGFHPFNAGLLWEGRPRFVPCTPLGIHELLGHASIQTQGAHAVVLGRSNVVGKPMAALLVRKGKEGDATVTLAHTATRDPAAVAKLADILIVAAGRPGLVDASWIKPGATVIDVGIHKCADGTLCGDVLFDSALKVAGAISPVPGGVGPMTIAMLLRNTLRAARLQLEPKP